MDINSLKIKTYIEDEYKLAYAKARRELGPDLVIIDKKEVKEGGLFGFFGKKKIKVTFGIEKLKGKRVEKEKEILTALRDVAKKHITGLEEEKNIERPSEEKKEFKPLFEKAKEEKNQTGIYSPFAKDEKKSIDDIRKELGMIFSNSELEKVDKTLVREEKN
jgi:flagellar biosynthesis protein FlhF